MSAVSPASHRGVTGTDDGRRVDPALLAPTALPPSWPPSLQVLLGEPAGDVWAAVLGPLGGRLRSLTASTVTLRPDAAATVRYGAVVDWADGRATRESLAATTGAEVPPGAAVLEGAAPDGRPVTVGLWRWPLDPALPGLAWAASAARTAERLAGLGLDVGSPRLRLRAYRPGRRAVVEVTSPAGCWFLKVVRPAAVADLADRHRRLAASVPVPPVLAATDDGVVVLPGLPGTPMRTALAGDPAALPDPAALEALLDALPPVGSAGRRDPADPVPRVRAHATVLGMVCPGLAPRLDRLVAAVGAAAGTHPVVPVHGDFYEAQLLVSEGAVSGLLDVDTAGPGARIDDWATLLAHLALLERLGGPGPVAAYRARVQALLAGRLPAGELAARVAGVLVGLATGPFRVQQAGWAAATEARVALAEEWVSGSPSR
ncbi:Ser/Thr protein kinase RdoA (MazF antagonist) [Geodermatophilus tzadiensis]|uniref:Ser/Thr protein kinase RdoA (MazF antagonist) n=1 Tax=Geodermatophilus tzadiensis TaxID=1137988 RepID=A0A2T0TY39_9ACTN|nr:Ser/Thr protein kinase RdoA (MazF antagonist) [Geodermatophilus tzadiensis]